MSLSKEERAKRSKGYLPRGPMMKAMCGSCPFGDPATLAAKVAELGCEESSPIVTRNDAVRVAEMGMEFMCHNTLEHDAEAQITITPKSALICKGLVMYRRGEL